MSSVITFAANNDLFRKRKRVYRACENCKKRRKRCTHTFDGEENPNPPVAEPTNNPKRQRVEKTPVNDNSSEPQHLPSPSQSGVAVNVNEDASSTGLKTAEGYSRSQSASPSRFISHLDPQAILQREDQGASRNQNECGYWMHRSSNRKNRTDGQTQEQRALDRYLFTIDVSVLPPKEHLDSLLEIYFSSIHPLLPIVDSERPGRRRNGILLSPMILQAICITASRHDKAQPHLVIYGSQPIEPREFAQKLYKSVVAALNAKLETDRIVLIQALALLSLHVEGTDGAEQASMHLSQAIHHAHTLGMQFGEARADDRAEYFQQLFWCLWSLDKMNATMHGRPLLIHDRDNQLESPLSRPELKYTPFGIWLQISAMLDHVINFYRPCQDPSTTGWEEDFPGFESLIGDSGETLDPALLAVLELYYNSVAMCSHKARPMTEPVPSVPSYVRKGLATVRVIQILGEESLNDLPPLPVVPWALSLAVANAYRQFRQSRVPTHRNRAKMELQKCCDLLEKIKPHWWSAGTMADLGRCALKKASKSQDASDQKRKEVRPGHGSVPTTNSSGIASMNSAGTIQDQPLEHQGAGAAESSNPTANPTTPSPNAVSTTLEFNATISPDWLNFDAAFENFDAVLGSSGADLSMELLRPFPFFEQLGSQGLIE